jgi:hypothetical protein
LDDEDGQRGIQSDQEKVIKLRPLQPFSVKTLEKKDSQMNRHEKEEEHNDVRFQRWYPFVNRKDVSVKAKSIGIKKGNQNPDEVTQQKNANQTTSLSFNHFLLR